MESYLKDVKRAEHILYYHRQKTGAQNISFVEHNNCIYWSKEYLRKIPYSPVIILLQNIFDQKFDQSFFILRNRIYYTGEFNFMDLGMLKVVAKRGTDKITAQSHDINIETLSFYEIFYTTLNPLEFFGINTINKDLEKICKFEADLSLEKLVNLNPEAIAKHDQDRQIAAVLVDRNNQVLSVGINSNSQNKTLHAEVVMLQKYYYLHQQFLPVGAKIISSHKPCKMCAGMIFEMSQSNEQPFVYYEYDMTGAMNSLGVLDLKKLSTQISGLIKSPIRHLNFHGYN